MKTLLTKKIAAFVAAGALASGLGAAGFVSTATAASSGCTQTLYFGTHGDCVKTLQWKLNARGAHLAVDGSFGPKTRAAVLEFQRSNHLKVDGYVGPQTKKALNWDTDGDSHRPVPAPSKAAAQVVKNAEDALAGKPVASGRLADGTSYVGWKGGKIPYQWGGGHGALGPSVGIPFPGKPEERGHLGLDCSGFTRWVTARAYGRDVLGPAGATAQYDRLEHISARDAKPGDIIFFGRPGDFPHTAVYIGNGMMIHEANFADDLIKSRVSDHGGTAYYGRPRA